MTVIQGDCLDVLKDLPDGCVTAIVTDPPYGLEFMGKGWDKVLPPTEVWREALRVLRPGGHALIFGGTRTYHRLACSVEDAGFEVRDCLMWLYGQGFPKAKSCLKPAWEPILLARKPGPVQMLNIDGCRIGPGHDNGRGRDGEASADRRYDERGAVNIAATPGPRGGDPAGRWPANVILDEEAGALLDAQAPTTGQAAPLKETGRDRPGHGRLGEMGPPVACEPHDGLGGASRFFYCAKASKRDRGAGNEHPTVKPVEIVRWLVRLVKGPGDNLVLDPFGGSGTTGVACQLEDVPFLLIEREAAYVAIAESRLA